MDRGHAGRFAMYGAFAGAALAALAMRFGFHSLNSICCTLQCIAITLLGTVIGLAAAYGLGRILAHIKFLLLKARRPARQLLKIGLWMLPVVLLLIAGSFIYSRFETRIWLNKLSKADRIVVRDGGFDCCGLVDEEAILFEVNDPDEIQKLVGNLEFAGKRSPCDCCGFPGIDWYRGGERIALTAIQHGKALRNRGSDLELTAESREAIVAWLVGHGVSKKEIDGGCGGPRRNLRRELPLMKEALSCIAQGDEFAEKGNLKKAIAQFDRAINLEPVLTIAYFKRACAHEKNEDRDEAIDDLTHAISWDNRTASDTEIMLDPIQTEFNEARRLDGKRAFAYYMRGRLYKEKGEDLKAEDDFAEAKKLGYKTE